MEWWNYVGGELLVPSKTSDFRTCQWCDRQLQQIEYIPLGKKKKRQMAYYCKNCDGPVGMSQRDQKKMSDFESEFDGA